ncbi:MAG: hypothetical protein HZC55_09255 [Verrucomicrobia bacterium]|nr:hypothetical protein [Verrucomicrobiota bacterium]
MNPDLNPAPEKPIAPVAPVAPIAAPAKLARGVEKQHNREVGHFLKSSTRHSSNAARRLSHSRGR